MTFNHLNMVLFTYGARTVSLLEPVKDDVECTALVYIRRTGGSIENKVKEHHHRSHDFQLQKTSFLSKKSRHIIRKATSQQSVASL